MISVILFLGANSSKYIAAKIPSGKDKSKHTNNVKKDPTNEDATPASSGSLESAFVKNDQLSFETILFFEINSS